MHALMVRGLHDSDRQFFLQVLYAFADDAGVRLP